MEPSSNLLVQNSSRSFARECALSYFDHIEGQVGLAHNKANILVAANALISMLLVTILKEFRLFEILDGVVILALSLSVLSVLFGLCIALWTSRPTSKWDYGGKEEDDCRVDGQEDEHKDIYFYRTITCTSREDAISEGLKISDEDAERALWVGIHGKAKWTERKFRKIRWAINFTVYGLLAFLVILGCCYKNIFDELSTSDNNLNTEIVVQSGAGLFKVTESDTVSSIDESAGIQPQ